MAGVKRGGSSSQGKNGSGARNSNIPDSIVQDIKGYTAQGGQLASKYPFNSQMRNELFEYISDKEIVTTQDLYRKIDLTSSDYNKLFNSIYENGEYTFDFDRLQSFTAERSRAFTFGGTSLDYVILKIPKGTKVSGMDIADISVYPQEKETLLGKNKFITKYDNMTWTSNNYMILELQAK